MATRSVFRGYLNECLQHCGRVVEKDARYGKYRQEFIASHCGVERRTVQRWLSANMNPVGESRIKVAFFLSLLGYSVIEFDKVPQRLRNGLELIGFDILSVADLSEKLGYAEPYEVLRALSRSKRLHREKEEKLWEIWKNHKQQLQAKKDTLLRQYESCGLQQQLDNPAIQEETKALVETVSENEGSVPTRVSVLLMQALDKTMSDMNCDDLTRAEKNLILRLFGRFSKLSALVVEDALAYGGERNGR